MLAAAGRRGGGGGRPLGRGPFGRGAFAFGLGLEVNLPIPHADIRLPFSLRGNYNPGVKGTRDERANHQTNATNITREDFSTAWKFQATGTFGAAWHF